MPKITIECEEDSITRSRALGCADDFLKDYLHKHGAGIRHGVAVQYRNPDAWFYVWGRADHVRVRQDNDK
jgi:hypothetical protein